MDTLLRQVRQTLQAFQMLERGQTLLVAVSGGPDSVAMLHLLARLRHDFDLKLIVAHLNHRMRPEAVDEARFVRESAEALRLPCVCESRDVPAYQRHAKLSPEDAARRVRYAFLRSTAARLGAQRIALGHTADDQAETVLLRLLRGAGMKGLAGMPPVRGPIIRPLIHVRRRDLLAFLRAQRLSFREDPSNQQRLYTRNRLRLDVLPLLQRHYNPRLIESLCATAQLVADDEAALQALASQHFRTAQLPAPPGEVRLHVGQLNRWSPALRRRVVRQALREVSGSLQGFTYRHIAAILGLCAETAGSKWTALPRRLVAERRYEVLHIRSAPATLAVAPAQPLPIPGRCTMAALGLTVTSQLLDRGVVSAPFPRDHAAWLDAAAVGGEVWVRTRQPGDRFQPLGCPQPKRLKAVFIDAKVPRRLRDGVPLIVTERGIAWVAGVQIAEWAKVTPATRQILGVRVTPYASETAPITGCMDSQRADFPIVFH
jgi:tRNA(Ile)-lysidine synthase